MGPAITITGRLVDAQGNAILGCFTWLQEEEDRPDGTSVARTLTNTDGLFTFHGVPCDVPLRFGAKRGGSNVRSGEIRFSGPGAQPVRLTLLDNDGSEPELRVRYLVSSYQAGHDGVEVPRAEPSGANRLEGPFVVDTPIFTPLTVGTGDQPSVVKVSRVEFNVRDRELIATLHAGYSSWPDSWWLIRVDLLDDKGDVVGCADHECHASAIVSGGRPLYR